MIETYTPLSPRIKSYQVVSEVVPEFAISENPLFSDFLKQYFISQDFQGGPADIAENIDAYIKVDNLTVDVIRGTTILDGDITENSDSIVVDSTDGYPNKFGLLKIDDEIISYTDKTSTTFTGCTRGFSGISSYRKQNDPSNLVWEQTTASSHSDGASVINVSSLFLSEFYKKLKSMYTPGLEGVNLSPDLDINNFIKEARSLYEAKGTRASFKILFKALFGIDPKINDLEKFLIKPSYANYIRRKTISVELISGDPVKLVGETLFQDNDPTNPNFNEASGPISEVSNIRDNFFKISLFTGFDERSLTDGEFAVVGRTRSIGEIGIGASVLTVDSTIGFSTAGTIRVGEETDSFYQELEYRTKSVNQFFGVTPPVSSTIPDNSKITAPNIVYGYEDGDSTKKVEMRLTGGLDNFTTSKTLRNLKETSDIKVKNLGRLIQNPDNGKTYEEVFFNSWIYNTSTRYQVDSFSGSSFSLLGKIDASSLRLDDNVEIVLRNSSLVVATNLKVSSVNTSNNTVSLDGSIPTLNSTLEYDVRRIQKKSTSNIVPIIGGQSQYLSDINNTYVVSENESISGKRESFVASSSLPSYKIFTDKIHSDLNNPSISNGNWQGFDSTVNKYSIISFDDPVPFRTGDEIYYDPSNASESIGGLTARTYFVEVLGLSNQIKLYSSRAFIGANVPIKFIPPSDNSGIHDFILASQGTRSIFPSRPIRRYILEQDLTSGKEAQTTSEVTPDGNTGMLVNGIEILNYKAENKIYFGPLEKLNIINSGKNYNVQNPPSINIVDDNVSAANTAGAIAVVSGNIKNIFVDPVDFDIDQVINIEIYGGNGKGAIGRALLEEKFREVFFNGISTASGGDVQALYNSFLFEKNHNFVSGERIVYDNNGGSNLGIATTGASNEELTLMSGQSYYANIIGTKEISLHYTKNDAVLGINTVLISEDAALQNSGVHIFRTFDKRRSINRISVEDPGEGYTNRHLIVKTSGINTYRDLIEFENHGFNDGDIVQYSYDTSGIVGLDTSKQYQIIKLNKDEFRLSESGERGSREADTTNFDIRKHVFLDSTGSGYQRFFFPPVECKIKVITRDQKEQELTATPVLRGEIVDTILYEKGSNYGSTILNFESSPNITIPFGTLGQIGLVISNGRINDAFVQNGGSGYSGPPDLEVISTGSTATGAILRSVVEDGSITDVKVISGGVGYANTTTSVSVVPVGNGLRLDANVRPLILNKGYALDPDEMDYLFPSGDGLAVNVVGYGNSIRTFLKDDGSGHSPIIGWAYDGNPIYGPYGLDDPDNIQSGVKRMISSYEIRSNSIENRPNSTSFPFGYFIKDYVYTGSGDLDEHNGRFTKTPDFPNGVYAYFATVDILSKPQFPYFVGDKYRSFPIEENILKGKVINQIDFDFENSPLVRNALPYNLFGDGVSYDYVFQPYNTNNQVSNPSNLLVGSVDEIIINSPGSGYSVNDKFYFNEEGTGGVGLDAEVSRIFGKTVDRITSSSDSFTTVPIKHSRQGVIFKIDPYHEFSANDTIKISGLSTYIDGLEGNKKIAVEDYSTTILDDGYTGVVTDIKVSFVPPNVSAGDSIGIGTETVRLLNAFYDQKIVRVERYAGFTTSSAGAAVTYFTSQFTVPVETDPFDSDFQNIIYFNPKESVGVGTTVGFSTSVNVSLGGVVKTRSILSQSIFLEGHGLYNNDLITFDNRGNSNILATDSNDPWTPPSSLSGNYYVVRKTDNTIGIKTIVNGPELFFTTTGDDIGNYSFTTNYDQETADVTKNQLTVVTREDHDLSVNDSIQIIAKPGLATGIGTSTMVDVKLIDGYTIIQPVSISTAGINTITNTFEFDDHNLETGFKVLLYGKDGVPESLPGGLEQRTYFVLKIDNSNFKLSNTYNELFKNPPQTVGFTTVGVDGISINPINPPINVYRRNDVVFNLNDSSLTGAEFKIFYDNNFFNEYVGTGSTENLEVVGFGTVGIGTTNPSDTPFKKIIFNPELRNTLYYAIEKGGYISTSDFEVFGYNEIKYNDSSFSGTYSVSGVGSTTFTANLAIEPEFSQYLRSDCEELYYTTTSIGATGGISKVRINNSGFNYQSLPGITSIGNAGISADLELFGDNINKLDQVTIPTSVYGYPSDNTLKPDAFLPRIIKIKNGDKVIDVSVTFGGRSYLNAPSLSIFDKTTGEIIENGLVTCELSDSAVNSATVVVQPRGLTENDYGVAPIRNSNGISIVEAFSDAGFLTCKITTPVLGYVNEPFEVGDTVFLEGVTFNNDGDGFNSGDYKFIDFEIFNYNSAVNPRQVTFSYSGLTTNTGTGATVAPGFGQVVKSENLARFEASKSFSAFKENEPLRRNDDLFTDLIMNRIDTNTGVMVISGSLNLEIDDKITGTNSGDFAEVESIVEFDGYFEITPTIDTNVGWSNNIGIIGDNNQFLPDNDYYQNMSYAIESEKTFDEIITYVNDIVHPAGFKNFANTQILSVGNAGEGLSPAEDAAGLVLDFIGDPLRVDAIYNYDLSRDVDAVDNVSKFLELQSTRLSDFILSKTNRVLIHDDISPEFVSNQSNDLSDSRTIAATISGRYYSRYLVQTTHSAENPQNNQYQLNELILVTVDQDTYLLQKSNLNNTNQVGLATGYAEFFAEFNPNSNNTQVKIKPYESLDTNYEIKALQQGFSDSVGVGSTNLGNVVNSSSNKIVGIGTTTNITGFSTDTFVAGIGQFLIVDKDANKVDYVELALQWDGDDTYLTELASFNTRQSLGGLSSPTFMGTFTSYIDSGIINIDYVHTNTTSVDVKSKFISFENVGLGTTTVKYFNIPFTPEGTERSARIVVGSSATTGVSTVVGVSSNIDLSFKSTVHITIGSTQTLHQIYVLSDPEKLDTFITQQPIAAIGTTTGIGTFGAEFSNNKVNLEFYPDPGVSGMISMYSYNEVLYKDEDPNGTLSGIGSFSYGQVFENVTSNTYLGINNRNIRSFELKHKGVPIYERNFNIENPLQVVRGNGLINLQHFFSNTEEVTYTPDSNLVGVAASAIHYSTGYGSTELPSTVFIVKQNNNQFNISTSISDARLGVGVTFAEGTGSGNIHRFTMNKRDSKSIISINGLVQKPISHTSISYDLDRGVNGIVTVFAVSGLSTIRSGDLLEIEDEYSIVKTVGFGSTYIGPITGIGTWSLVEVERGAVGSAATDHAAGESARIYRGSFQILNSTVHFTEAPLGGDLGLTNSFNLPFPRATFSGRTYLRSDYRTNEVFDDISDKFDGLENTFDLTTIGSAVTGIGTTGGNGVLFINGIFQAPFGENNEGVSNFKIIEEPVSTAASVQFTGITSFGFTDLIIDEDDINQNQLPRGGIIVSVASTPGQGYAPFRGASVRLEVGTGGTITGVVGVPTAGTAININDAAYDKKTGILTVTTASAHNLKIENQLKLVGLEFTCPGGSGITTTIFPDYDDSLPVTGIISATMFKTNVGPSTIAHTYVSGGTVARWYPLTFGSGYQTGLGTIGIAVSSTTGTAATVNATVGAGGTLIFSVTGPGTNYSADDFVNTPEPNGESLPIVGVSRIGLGNTTLTGVGCSISVQVSGVSTATGIGSTLFQIREWEFVKKGYGFKRGDVFTVSGLSTDPKAGDNYEQFEIEVIDVFTDEIASWQFGNIDYLDNISAEQDGERKRFALYYQRQLVSFEIDRNDQDSKEIDLSAVLLIFINGVIQEPNVNYSFNGGSVIEFTSPPTKEDQVIIFFYRGSIGQDSFIFDVNETIRVGDSLKLGKSTEVELNRVEKNSTNFAQLEDRIIKRIDSAATVETPFYQGPGISNDNYKPFTWTKQKKDLLIDGELVPKTRDSIEARINPAANIIGILTSSDTEVFVDTVGLFRDTDGLLNESFDLFAIASVGFGTTAASGVNFENLSAIQPLVANVQGYIGVVTGIGTTTGIGTDLAIKIDFDVASYVNDGNDSSGLSTGYPFKLYGTGINTAGVALTSIDTHDTDIVSISTYYGDNIYYAHAISFKNSGRNGIITANIASYTDVSDFVGVGSTAGPYAHFTWGRFSEFGRSADPISLDVKGLDFDPQLSQYPEVFRRGVGLRGTGALPKLL